MLSPPSDPPSFGSHVDAKATTIDDSVLEKLKADFKHDKFAGIDLAELETRAQAATIIRELFTLDSINIGTWDLGHVCVAIRVVRALTLLAAEETDMDDLLDALQSFKQLAMQLGTTQPGIVTIFAAIRDNIIPDISAETIELTKSINEHLANGASIIHALGIHSWVETLDSVGAQTMLAKLETSQFLKMAGEWKSLKKQADDQSILIKERVLPMADGVSPSAANLQVRNALASLGFAVDSEAALNFEQASGNITAAHALFRDLSGDEVRANVVSRCRFLLERCSFMHVSPGVQQLLG